MGLDGSRDFRVFSVEDPLNQNSEPKSVIRADNGRFPGRKKIRSLQPEKIESKGAGLVCLVMPIPLGFCRGIFMG